MKIKLPLIISFVLLFFSNTLSVFSQLQSGDTITVNGLIFKVLSNNLIPNPGFEDGFTGWTDATSSAAVLSSANFSLINTGGVENSQYLTGLKNESSTSAGSIGTGWPIQAGKKYYFSYHIKYLNSSAVAGTEEWAKVSLTNNKTSNLEPLVLINSSKVNAGGIWTKNEITFTNSNPAYTFLVTRFRWLNNRLGFDSFSLHEVGEITNIGALQKSIDDAIAIYKPDAIGAAELQIAISTAQGYLSSQSASEVSKAIADLNEAVKKYKIRNASPANPLDMTNYIVNPGFDNNTPVGWKGIGVINYHEVEFYQRTFNMYQKIIGLPAGKYILRAQGFERSKSNDGGTAYRAGTETIYAKFYAASNSFSEKTTPFNSLYKHTYPGTGSLNGYINTMASAETMLTNVNKYYDTAVSDILLNTGDTLTIGAKSDFQQNGYWTLFDNFRLEYIGHFDSNDLVNELNRQITIANELLDKKMQNLPLSGLNAAITYAQQISTASPLVFSDLQNAADSINRSINAANTSIDAYIKLQNAINNGQTYLQSAPASKVTAVQSAIANGQTIVNDLNTTLSAINKATSDILNLINKKIYIPTWMMGNVNDPNNNWSYTRSKQSKNWIIFWEPGYGEDPSVLADGGYRIDIDGILNLAEGFYKFYADSLKFITPGAYKSDTYKMIIRLRYTRDWEASGSGVDDTIGLLTLTAWSAQAGGHTLAHEVGHCFQYQVHCDNNNQNGWMYGFGLNTAGGNGWWEQCAQWQAFKIYPEQQFTDGRFAGYLKTAHKHILHESPRYDNYFIHDYFTYRHGMDIIGRLWNMSNKPEDPVETYKRITSISQSQFNDEMYDQAARFTTWDIPSLRLSGTGYINSRTQPLMKQVENNYWLIDSTVCIENYGYNVIKLNAPTSKKTVSAFFEGKAGIDGFRKLNLSQAGWRFGFVALLNDGSRIYSEMGSANYQAPTDSVHFECPDNCKQLWLVVSGAPATHWRHAWDDNDANDEQWPYQVSFNNTNRQGYQNIVSSVAALNQNAIQLYTSNKILYIYQLPENANIRVYNIAGACIINEKPMNTTYSTTLSTGSYIVNINGSYNRKIIVK